MGQLVETPRRTGALQRAGDPLVQAAEGRGGVGRGGGGGGGGRGVGEAVPVLQPVGRSVHVLVGLVVPENGFF